MGYVVSASGVSVDLEKVEAFISWERTKSIFKIRSFLVLVGYYRRFIEDFSRLAAPMTRLTWNEVKFEWNCKTRENFNFLKNSKMIISVKIQNFSRSRMTKRTSPLESSPEIKLPCQTSSNSETVGNCTYFKAIGQMSK